MKPLPLPPETEALARRLVWFEEPAEALADPVRFIAYVLESATHEDTTLLRHYVTEADLLGTPFSAARHHQAAFLGLLERADGALSGPACAGAEFGVIA